jgi:hypothetical protein
MSEALLKEIYSEVEGIRRKLELLEDAIIPKEKVSEEEFFEIQELKEESVKGEHVEWEELKREHSL